MDPKNAGLSVIVVLGLACGGTSSSEEKAATQLSTVETTNQHSSLGFVGDIEKLTEQNSDFRRVIYTAKHSQLVVMALPPGEHIGAETHQGLDQFFRVEEGTGEVMLGQQRTSLRPGSAIVVPAGTKHDVSATGTQPLKLYTIYSPPQHRDGVVHHTRADAENDTEHFDGAMTNERSLD